MTSHTALSIRYLLKYLFKLNSKPTWCIHRTKTLGLSSCFPFSFLCDSGTGFAETLFNNMI